MGETGSGEPLYHVGGDTCNFYRPGSEGSDGMARAAKRTGKRGARAEMAGGGAPAASRLQAFAYDCGVGRLNQAPMVGWPDLLAASAMVTVVCCPLCKTTAGMESPG